MKVLVLVLTVCVAVLGQQDEFDDQEFEFDIPEEGGEKEMVEEEADDEEEEEENGGAADDGGMEVEVSYLRGRRYLGQRVLT